MEFDVTQIHSLMENVEKRGGFPVDRDYIRTVIDNLTNNTPYFPFFFQLQTINACNGKCIMCPGNSGNSKHTMSEKLYKKIIDEIASEKGRCKVALMLQNEPLLDEYLVPKIRYIKKCNIDMDITTNGSLINEELVKELEATSIDRINISLDSMDKNTFEKIRPSFKFDEIMKKIDLVANSRLGSRLVINITAQRMNGAEIDDMRNYFKQRGIKTMVSGLSNRAGSVENYDFIKNNDANEREKNYVMDKICLLPFCQFSILSGGDVLLCCQDWEHSILVGNTERSSIKEIWNSDLMREHRLNLLNKKYDKIITCKKCSEIQ